MRFEFCNPTRLLFGAGNLDRLGEEVRRLGKRALLVIGGRSAKAGGTFDRASASLKAAGVSAVEMEGIEPNPRLSTVARGAALARREAVDVVVGLGGGSAMDAAKVIAASVFYEGELWEMFVRGPGASRPPSRALPIVTVPTLAATGSEMNCGAVVTNEKTTEKSIVQASCLYPRLALVDPELTLTVPASHTAYGIADLLTHVTEGYFNGVDGTPLQDRFAEGVVHTALEWGPKAVANGRDLEARTQIQWCSVVALNGWVQAGVRGPFPAHILEHALSAHHDVPHGAGLAVISPAWMRLAAAQRPEKFAQFGERLFGLEPRPGHERELAQEAIGRYQAFLHSLGCPTRLSELGIGRENLARFAQDALRLVRDRENRLPGRPALSEAELVRLLESAL